MKPEKPKKAKAPAKRALKSVKEKLSALFKRKPAGAEKAVEPPKKTAAKKKPSASPALTETVAAEPPAAAPKKASASARSPRSAAKKISVPPILREGDAPSATRPSGPGQRYEIGGVERAALAPEPAELPESYGTQRLLLVARDPHWLYAHWDLTAEQLRKHNAASRDKHLIVQVFQNAPTGKPVLEQHVHPESRNWFLHVGRGGAKFVAQLGYYDRAGAWFAIATSAATFTPPDALSDDTSVRFETIPIEVPFKKLLELVKGAVAEHVPLVEIIQQLRESGFPELPAFSGASRAEPSAWTAQQEAALAQIISIDEVRRVWMGSLEITELLRRSLEREISSQAAAMLARGELAGAAELGGVSSISSPFGGEGRRKGFWFNVNAELIIYGATEPDANVTIGGRKIQLRPDGTFSFRFALPDGVFSLPVQATSADTSDSRSAALSFSRATQYRGEVGMHPQDVRLKTPRVENVA